MLSMIKHLTRLTLVGVKDMRGKHEQQLLNILRYGVQTPVVVL